MNGLNKLFQLICALSLLWGGSAFAVDGVLEINQACATNGGCFTGDNPGLPVTITQDGSYLLTSNLAISHQNTSGITVTAPNVTIDLNGFSIIGITVCEDTPLSCSPEGAGVGVSCTTPCENLTARNGSIIGMGSHGVFLGKYGRVADLSVTSNGGDGIRFVNAALVQDCFIRWNGDAGIVTSTSAPNILGANITGNIILGNAGFGMNLTGPAVVVGNTIAYNEQEGLFGGEAGYNGNVFFSNDGTVVAGANEMGVNICDGDTTCP